MPSWESRSCWLSCARAETGSAQAASRMRGEACPRSDVRSSTVSTSSSRHSTGWRSAADTAVRLAIISVHMRCKQWPDAPFAPSDNKPLVCAAGLASRDTASLHSIEGKSNAAGIRFRVGKIEWKGLSIPAMFDPQRPRRLASRHTPLRDEILPCHSTDDPGPGPLVGAARPEGDAACEDPAGAR